MLLVAGAVLYILAGILLPGRDSYRRPWWPPLLGLAAGTLVAGLLAPGWPGAFGREFSRLGDASAIAFFEKLDAIALTLGQFVGVPGLVADVAGVALGAAVVAVIVLLLIPRTRRALVSRIQRARPGWWTILFFLLVTAGGVCLQNLLFLSMPPLISARYLAMAWPFVAFLPLLVFGIWPRLRYALTAAFCLLVLIPATIAAPLLSSGGDRLPLGRLSQADAVLIDNVGAGELPRFLWPVPAGVPVFAGTQEELLAREAAWRDVKLGDLAYYVSILRSGGDVSHRRRILAGLRAQHDVTLVGTNGVVEIYAVTPKLSL